MFRPRAAQSATTFLCAAFLASGIATAQIGTATITGRIDPDLIASGWRGVS